MDYRQSQYPEQGTLSNPYEQQQGYLREPTLSLDQIQQEFLTKIYGWMVAGLLVTGVLAYVLGQANITLPSNMYMILSFVQLGMVFAVGARNLPFGMSVFLFFTYAAINGLLLSFLFIVDPITNQPIIPSRTVLAAFVVTAGTFGLMALYGLTTKRSLATVGSYLIMAMWGVLLASIVGIFWDFPGRDFIVMYVGLGVFVGLVAYFNWQYKEAAAYARSQGEDFENRMAIQGALSLYISFIAIFIRILSILSRD